MIDSTKDMTVGQFFEVLAANEYPDYIRELIAKLQEWMSDVIVGTKDGEKLDPVTALFEADSEPDGDDLFESLAWVEKYADLIPNTKRPKGREDVVVVNVGAGELDSCMRMAADYASLFNREHCKRVWIVSDNFDLVDIANYFPHISTLRERGVVFRFILVCPWGWVEVPLECREGETARDPQNQVSWKASGVPKVSKPSKNTGK